MAVKRGEGDSPRVYRPCRLSEVYGQEKIKQGIKAMLESGKVYHSFLFHGESGTGKTTIARIVAMGLLTHLNTPEVKKQLVQKAIDEKWTVAKLRAEIAIEKDKIKKQEDLLKAKKSKKQYGFQEWTESKDNVNICTGCENDCLYCYAKEGACRVLWSKLCASNGKGLGRGMAIISCS